MRKILSILIVLTLFLAAATESHAFLRKDLTFASGKIVAIDTTTKTVTIRVNSSGNEMTFNVRGKMDGSLKKGDDATVMYKIGTTIANWVKRSK